MSRLTYTLIVLLVGITCYNKDKINSFIGNELKNFSEPEEKSENKKELAANPKLENSGSSFETETIQDKEAIKMEHASFCVGELFDEITLINHRADMVIKEIDRVHNNVHYVKRHGEDKYYLYWGWDDDNDEPRLVMQITPDQINGVKVVESYYK